MIDIENMNPKTMDYDQLVSAVDDITTSGYEGLAYLVSRIRVPATQIAYHAQDKQLNNVAIMVLGELEGLLDSDKTIYLDKYAACDRGATVKARRVYSEQPYTDIWDESLALLRSAGLRTTVMFYMLFIKHLD